MSQQKYPKAYEAYQQAVYRDGKNPTFWCSIGVLYYQINQYRDALDAYSRAIRLNPYISEVWYDLGTLVCLSARSTDCSISLTHSSMNLAIIRSQMLWMPISGLPSSTLRTPTLRRDCSFYDLDLVMADPHQQLPNLPMCIRKPTRPPGQSVLLHRPGLDLLNNHPATDRIINSKEEPVTVGLGGFRASTHHLSLPTLMTAVVVMASVELCLLCSASLLLSRTSKCDQPSLSLAALHHHLVVVSHLVLLAINIPSLLHRSNSNHHPHKVRLSALMPVSRILTGVAKSLQWHRLLPRAIRME
jgi:hypothetical protein